MERLCLLHVLNIPETIPDVHSVAALQIISHLCDQTILNCNWQTVEGQSQGPLCCRSHPSAHLDEEDGPELPPGLGLA